jgi:hypothetical protein
MNMDEMDTLRNSIIPTNVAELDRLWRLACDNEDSESLFEIIFRLTVLGNNTRILDWMLGKKPDVASWRGAGIWMAADKIQFGCSCGKWLTQHTSLQTLALNDLLSRGINYPAPYSEDIVAFLQEPEPCLELNAAIFQSAVYWGERDIVRMFIGMYGKTALRVWCLSDGGKVLGKPLGQKMIRVLRPLGLSRSDYASVGLSWPAIE